MNSRLIVLILTFVSVCRAGADEISAYAISSRQEVAATKQKLRAKDGIFNDFNYSGTLIREAKPEDRAPASVEAESVDESDDK